MTKFKIFYFLKILLLIFIISSCSKDSEVINNKDSNYEIELRQTSINFAPAPCEVVSDLTIFIPDDCGPNWTAGILSAIQAYNDIDIGVNFEQTDNQDDADISFSCIDFANGVDPDTDIDFSGIIAFGELPNADGGIGPETILNTDFETSCTDPCFFQAVVMHELGHNLGLMHNENAKGENAIIGDIVHDGDGTFTFPTDGDDIVFIEGTAPEGTTDPNSVFNLATDCLAPNCAFNDNDIIALESLYPRPTNPCDCPLAFEPCACLDLTPLNITFPTDWEEEGCIPEDHFLTVCAYGWPGDGIPVPDVTFDWTSTGSIIIENDNTDMRCIQISVGTEGGTISVWVEADNCDSKSIHRTIEICDEDGGTVGTGNNPGPPKKGRPKDIE